MDQLQINKRLILCAAGKRYHPHYKRTVSKAALYTALSTGDGIAAYMKKYSRRETDTTFNVRVEITEQVTPSICSSLFAVQEKAYRSFYRRELGYGIGEIEEEKTAAFEAMLSKYAGGMGVDGFCQDRLIELNSTDPNTWVIQEWKSFDNVVEFAEPYPFEASSADAVDFQYLRGDLKYLTVKTHMENPAGGDPICRVTCYQKNLSSTLTQTGKIVNRADSTELIAGQMAYIDGKEWEYREYWHNLGEIKAKRVGYKRDKLTSGNTYVWPIEAAEPYLLQTLKVVSELQITAANVAMPQTIRFGDICRAPGCDGGYTDSGTCGTCKGTGKKESSTSVLEEIVITPMPESAADMIDLSKVIHYVSPDVSILQWQEQYVDRLEEKCRKAVLNSEMYSKAEVAETATGKNLDQDNANDFVYKYFKFYADFWQFTVYAFADITGKRSGLTAQIVVNKDLKLKTLNQLLDDLRLANESGAGPAARANIEWDIMRVMTIDAPQDFIEYQVRERFNPFSGFTSEEKAMWAQSDLVPRRHRVLYANLGHIFDTAERANSGFYKMPHESQAAILDEILDEIMAETQPVTPQLFG